MNINRTFLLMTLLGSALIVSAQSMSVKLAEPPAGSGIAQSYDEASDTYTLYVENNNFSDVLPTVQFEPLAQPLPAELRTIAFEYMSDTPVGWEILRLEKVFNGRLNKEVELHIRVDPSDKWETMRIPVGEYRDARTIQFGNKGGEIVKWTWRDLVDGATIKMRNIRYEVDKLPYKEVQVKTGTTVVEAEDYLISASNSGYTSRSSSVKLQDYHHPVNAGEYPIMAWTGYSVVSGSPEDMERIKQGYRWMADAGFNITQGLNFPGCNMAALYDGNEVNGYYIDVLPDDVNLKLLIDPGSNVNDMAEWIPQYKNSPRLGGYYVRDEPYVDDLEAMGDKVRNIRSFDDTRMLYGNLFAVPVNAREIGAKNWDHYVHTYFEKTGISYLSYDIYPVHENLSTGEIYLMPEYFENLEIANRLCRYYDIPFWAFVHACSCSVPSQGYGNPVPTEEIMRLQAFGNLAYGAQGLAYYPYVTPAPWAENLSYANGPISYEGEKTKTWYYCQNINREIQALSWVFLGSELLYAGHTNATVPKGCRRLTAAMLPEQIGNVTSDGAGVCVTTLQNGRNKFLMVVNSDVNNAQTVTIEKKSAVKRVLADGTTATEQAGDIVELLPVGGYVLLLVEDNAEPIVHYAKAGSTTVEPSAYRLDSENVIIAEEASASGNHYIANMGADSWESYSEYMTADKNCIITREDAIANWGAEYKYIVNVPEDVYVNVYVGHSVPWDQYGKVVATGARPGFTYMLDEDPTLDWPATYAASMTFAVDGEIVKPTQTARPVAPSTYDPDGVEFNRILADKSLWTSTVVNGEQSDVLYFWPKAGGDNSLDLRYNDTPDYVGVHLTAGTHELTVSSLSYPWHFDALKLVDTETSGIVDVVGGDESHLTATGVKGGIVVNADKDFTVYNLSGVAVASGHGSALVDLGAGFYIVNSGKTSLKVVVK